MSKTGLFFGRKRTDLEFVNALLACGQFPLGLALITVPIQSAFVFRTELLSQIFRPTATEIDKNDDCECHRYNGDYKNDEHCGIHLIAFLSSKSLSEFPSYIRVATACRFVLFRRFIAEQVNALRFDRVSRRIPTQRAGLIRF